MDLNSKTAEKLFGTVAEGVGALANHWLELDAKKIKRIGEAEAEAEKQKIIKQAEATESALEVLARADKRFLLEQYSKQINLENIIVMARDAIGDSEVSDEPVDPDWSRRFVSVAQDISREDMQQMLANILAGEVKQPETFSLRTLDFVSNIGKKELQAFSRILPYTNLEGHVYISKSNANEGFAGFSYSQLMELIDYGFIKPTLTTVTRLPKVTAGQKFIIHMKAGLLIFDFNEDVSESQLPVLPLTRVATELLPLMNTEVNKDELSNYVEELREFYETKKLTLVRPESQHEKSSRESGENPTA